MRVASFSRLVPVSLVLVWMTLAAGLAQAADARLPLTANEQAFLTRAMNDNASQIAAAKLALAKSSNPRVIELANTIIQQRTALDDRMAQWLPSHGQLPQAAAGNTMLEHMQTLRGEAFDHSFASAAVRSHCRMISAYEAIKLNSTNPALQDFAHAAIPALRGNLTVAMTLLRSSAWPPQHAQAVASADTSHTGSKAPVFWEPVSLVAAPW